jgi:hypothetical protein
MWTSGLYSQVGSKVGRAAPSVRSAKSPRFLPPPEGPRRHKTVTAACAAVNSHTVCCSRGGPRWPKGCSAVAARLDPQAPDVGGSIPSSPTKPSLASGLAPPESTTLGSAIAVRWPSGAPASQRRGTRLRHNIWGDPP